MGLVMVNGGVLDRSIEHRVVGRDSAALGVVSLTNVAVVGLGGIGSRLGMAGPLLDGREFVVGGSMCRDASSRPITVGVVVAVRTVGWGTSGYPLPRPVSNFNTAITMLGV